MVFSAIRAAVFTLAVRNVIYPVAGAHLT